MKRVERASRRGAAVAAVLLAGILPATAVAAPGPVPPPAPSPTPDCRVTVQASQGTDALRTALGEGGVVCVTGTFEIGHPLPLRSGLHVVGRNARLRQRCSGHLYGFFAHDPTRDLRDVTLEGLELTARGCSKVTAGIQLRHRGSRDITVSGLTLRNLSIHHLNGPAVLIYSPPAAAGRMRIRRLRIDDLRVDSLWSVPEMGGNGVLIYAHPEAPARDLVVTRSRFSAIGLGTEKGPHGFGVNIAHARDVRLRGNVVERTCEDALRVNDSRRVVFEDNTTRTSLRGKACDAGGIKAADSDSVWIRGNRTRDHAWPHIEVLGGHGIRIEGNELRGGAGRGIVFWPSRTRGVTGAVVADNTLRGLDDGILLWNRRWDRAVAGLRVREVVVGENRFEGVARRVTDRR